MFILIGIAVVIVSVVVGYILQGGELHALAQPAEFLIIGGTAVGGLLIGTPMHTLKAIGVQLAGSMKARLGKEDYLELFSMLYQLFKLVQQKGVMALEPHFEQPAQSTLLAKYPRFLSRPQAVAYLGDSVKVMIMGAVTSQDLDALLEDDLRVRHRQNLEPAAVVARVGDALPGLGIVGAVLGVVITMGAIDGPASEVGHKVGAALVGTFLGVLLSYAFIQPLASFMEAQAGEQTEYFACMKAAIVANHKGLAPALSVEFARRVLQTGVRPTFEETEQVCKPTRGVDRDEGAMAA
jgi:chemotaxis protein MotA